VNNLVGAHAHTHTHPYTHIHTHPYTHTHTHAHTHTHTYEPRHTHTHPPTHTHTHTHQISRQFQEERTVSWALHEVAEMLSHGIGAYILNSQGRVKWRIR